MLLTIFIKIRQDIKKLLALKVADISLMRLYYLCVYDKA